MSSPVRITPLGGLGEIGKKADPGPEATTALMALAQKKDVQQGVKAAAEEAIDKIKGKVKDKDKEKP